MNNNNTHQKSYPLQAQQNIMNNNNNNNNKGKRIRKSQNNEGIIMNNKRASKNKEALKVVYISTPMKVTASASKFREIVQELTGRESDVVSIMETCGGNDTWMVPDDDDDHHHHNKPSLDHHDDGSSPSSSSEDLVDHGNDNDGGVGVFLKGQDCNFGIFDHSSSLFYDHLFQQFDLLGSY